MSKWDRQAVIAIAIGLEFYWIASHQVATQGDVFFVA
jgi:hypothetical protein